MKAGIQQVRVVLRALALLHLAKGSSAPQVAQVVMSTPQAIRKFAQRYLQGRMDGAVFEKLRPRAVEVLAPSVKHGQHLRSRGLGGRERRMRVRCYARSRGGW